ncbi:MAG: VanZ family protein, partial [Eubacterium sp.]|nr:VanZ family protein [Eubacterium sp.]
VEIFFEEYFIVPFLIAIILSLIVYLILHIHKKRKTIGQLITVPLTAFYFSELFYTTLLYRIGTKTDALANVFGEWSIYDGETSMYINPKPILNVILFLPICIAVFSFIKQVCNKTYSDKRILIYTALFSFSASLIIELIQLIFSIGTFQISDLVYNTVGGIIGAVIYIGLNKILIKAQK